MCLMGGGGREFETDTEIRITGVSRAKFWACCMVKPCGNRLGEYVETEWIEKERVFKRIRCRRKFALKGGKKLSPVRVLV